MKTSLLKRKRNLKLDYSLFNFGFFNAKTTYHFKYDDSMIKKNINKEKIEEYIWNRKETKLKLLKDFTINKCFIIKTERISKKIIFNVNQQNSMENKSEYIYHCLKISKYNLKQIIEITQIIPYKKFNLVLDIDLTMIKAIELNDTLNKRKETDIEICGIANKRKFHFYFRYRPYLFEFSKKLKKYFNFYISTLAHKNYAEKIVDNFKVETGILIPPSRISGRTDETMELKKKFINELIPLSDIEELNNTIIIDDNISSWIKSEDLDKEKKDTMQCIKCLIPSKRYVMAFPQNTENNKYCLLIHNNIFENGFSKFTDYSLDIEYSFCIEKDSISNNDFGQLYFLELFIKKCMKFSLLSGIPIIEVINFYRKKIFEDCFFNMKYLDNKWSYTIKLIIKELGGNISLTVGEATHFIIENKINPNNIILKNVHQKYININYIFQCYFNLYKFSEDDDRYNTVNINSHLS